MEFYLGPIVMILIFGLLASMVYVMIDKKNAKYIVYSFFFFALYIIFVLSAMKTFLGHKSETLFESFLNIQTVTYLHYGIALFVISIVTPLVLKFIFNDNLLKFIRLFDSTVFLVSFFAYVYDDDVNNMIVCFLYLLAILFTIIVYTYRIKNEVIFVIGDSDNLKSNVFKAIVVLIYWIMTIVIYLPNELYLTNTDDFNLSFWYYFGKLLLVGIVMLVISFIFAVLFLTTSQLNILYYVLFALITMGYIQGMFLNGSLSSLDGDIQTWTIGEKVVNSATWIVVVLAFIALCIWKKELSEKVVKYISVWLILVQVVSLGTLIVTTDGTERKSETTLTTAGMLELSGSNNILVFVLDKFDGRRMDEILEETPDFLEPLNDFIYYTNATSAFYPTGYSIPFLLTGVEYEDDDTDYYNRAYSQEDMLIRELSEGGYNIGLYTYDGFVTEAVYGIASNFIEGVERTCDTIELARLMVRSSKYKMMPFIAKNYFIYDSTEISALTAYGEFTNIDNDVPFYNNLVNTGLSINESIGGGTFKFYHMHGAHPPYTMTENFQYVSYDWYRNGGYGVEGNSQTKGAMKIVYEYIEQLKSLGLYDDATIIITADHGVADQETKQNGEVIQQSLPIMFVKVPYSQSDEITISEAPVCQADIISTIKNIAGVSDDGDLITEIDENEERVRVSRVRTGNIDIKYEIKGNVRDVESWEEIYSK